MTQILISNSLGEPYYIWKARTLSGLLYFSLVVTNWVANMIGDDRCFHQLLNPRNAITMTYSYTYCLIVSYDGETPTIDEITRGAIFNCEEWYASERNLQFAPPFVYSGDCRDAYLTNFVPVAICSACVSALLYPLFYFYVTYKRNNLEEEIIIGGCFNFGKLKEWIITGPYLIYCMNDIWSNFLILQYFGLVSPIASLAIGLSLVAKVRLLRSNFTRYFHLQFPSVFCDDNEEFLSKVERVDPHIEVICQKCHRNVHIILWPGFYMNSCLFGLYVFDMAIDTEDAGLGYPLALLCLTVLVVPVCHLVFNYYKSKLRKVQKRNAEMLFKDHTDNECKSQGESHVEMKEFGEAKYVKNPLQLSVDKRVDNGFANSSRTVMENPDQSLHESYEEKTNLHAASA